MRTRRAGFVLTALLSAVTTVALRNALANRGSGSRLVGKGGLEQETLVLTQRRQLSDKELQAANARALQLDRRAYRLAAEVWKNTPAATVR